MKMNKSVRSTHSQKDFNEIMEEIRGEGEDGRVWHENRVHHLLNKQRNTYDNYLVHTSKLYNIYRVNISAQFWILNETLNPMDLVFAEEGYTFDPITAESAFCKDESLFHSVGESGIKMRKSSLIDDMSFSKFSLDDMISSQDFKGISIREKKLLESKSSTIKCFTGTPFDMKKSSLQLTRNPVFFERMSI